MTMRWVVPAVLLIVILQAVQSEEDLGQTKVQSLKSSTVCYSGKRCHFNANIQINLSEKADHPNRFGTKDGVSRDSLLLQFDVVSQCSSGNLMYYRLDIKDITTEKQSPQLGIHNYPCFFVQDSETGKVTSVYFSALETVSGRKMKRGLIRELTKGVHAQALTTLKNSDSQTETIAVAKGGVSYVVVGRDDVGTFRSQHKVTARPEGGAILEEDISYLDETEVKRRNKVRTVLNAHGLVIEVKQMAKGQTPASAAPAHVAGLREPGVGTLKFKTSVLVKRRGLPEPETHCTRPLSLYQFEAAARSELSGEMETSDIMGSTDSEDARVELVSLQSEHLTTAQKIQAAQILLQAHNELKVNDLSKLMTPETVGPIVGLALAFFHDQPTFTLDRLKTVLGATSALRTSEGYAELMDLAKDASRPSPVRQQALLALLPRASDSPAPAFVLDALEELGHSSDEHADLALLLLGAHLRRHPAAEHYIQGLLTELAASNGTRAVISRALANSAPVHHPQEQLHIVSLEVLYADFPVRNLTVSAGYGDVKTEKIGDCTAFSVPLSDVRESSPLGDHDADTPLKKGKSQFKATFVLSKVATRHLGVQFHTQDGVKFAGYKMTSANSPHMVKVVAYNGPSSAPLGSSETAKDGCRKAGIVLKSEAGHISMRITVKPLTTAAAAVPPTPQSLVSRTDTLLDYQHSYLTASTKASHSSAAPTVASNSHVEATVFGRSFGVMDLTSWAKVDALLKPRSGHTLSILDVDVATYPFNSPVPENAGGASCPAMSNATTGVTKAERRRLELGQQEWKVTAFRSEVLLWSFPAIALTTELSGTIGYNVFGGAVFNCESAQQKRDMILLGGGSTFGTLDLTVSMSASRVLAEASIEANMALMTGALPVSSAVSLHSAAGDASLLLGPVSSHVALGEHKLWANSQNATTKVLAHSTTALAAAAHPLFEMGKNQPCQLEAGSSAAEIALVEESEIEDWITNDLDVELPTTNVAPAAATKTSGRDGAYVIEWAKGALACNFVKGAKAASANKVDEDLDVDLGRAPPAFKSSRFKRPPHLHFPDPKPVAHHLDNLDVASKAVPPPEDDVMPFPHAPFKRPPHIDYPVPKYHHEHDALLEGGYFGDHVGHDIGESSSSSDDEEHSSSDDSLLGHDHLGHPNGLTAGGSTGGSHTHTHADGDHCDKDKPNPISGPVQANVAPPPQQQPAPKPEVGLTAAMPMSPATAETPEAPPAPGAFAAMQAAAKMDQRNAAIAQKEVQAAAEVVTAAKNKQMAEDEAAKAAAEMNQGVVAEAQRTRDSNSESEARARDVTREEGSSAKHTVREASEQVQEEASALEEKTAQTVEHAGQSVRAVTRDATRHTQKEVSDLSSEQNRLTRRTEQRVEAATKEEGETGKRATNQVQQQINNFEGEERRHRDRDALRRQTETMTEETRHLEHIEQRQTARKEMRKLVKSEKEDSRSVKTMIKSERAADKERREFERMEKQARRRFAKEEEQNEMQEMKRVMRRNADVDGDERRRMDKLKAKMRRDEADEAERRRFHKMGDRVEAAARKGKEETRKLETIDKEVEHGRARARRATRRAKKSVEAKLDRISARAAATRESHRVREMVRRIEEREEKHKAAQKLQTSLHHNFHEGRKEVRKEAESLQAVEQHTLSQQQAAHSAQQLRHIARHNSEMVQEEQQHAADTAAASVRRATQTKLNDQRFQHTLEQFSNVAAAERKESRELRHTARKEARETAKQIQHHAAKAATAGNAFAEEMNKEQNQGQAEVSSALDDSAQQTRKAIAQMKADEAREQQATQDAVEQSYREEAAADDESSESTDTNESSETSETSETSEMPNI